MSETDFVHILKKIAEKQIELHADATQLKADLEKILSDLDNVNHALSNLFRAYEESNIHPV